MTLAARRVSALVVLAAILGTAACAVNPVTGKKEVMLISENAEIEMGKNTDTAIRQEFGLYEDPALKAYVERAARRMVPYTHRKTLAYHFDVLDTAIPNAFAAPGGYIYITRGLLAMMNSEAEMATVLAHELGHVNARHSVRKLSQQMLLMGGVVLAGALSEDVAKVAPFMMAGLQVLFLKYSRDDEYEADRLGILYSRSAGYSATQMIPFFQSIRKLEEESSGGPRLPNFLSTHPLTEKRIAEAMALLEPIDAEMDVLKRDFLARVDGLVIGENPRHGFVDGNAFYHPEMRFAFGVPDGWVVQNSPRQVILASKDEKAAMIMTAEKSGQDPGAHLQDQLQAFQDAQVLEISRGGRQINGLNAFRGFYHVSPKPEAEGQAVDPAKTVAVNLDCIQKDGIIYTFQSLAAKADFPAYENAINRTIGSFRRLTEPARLNVQPRRIAVRKAGAAQTLEAFLKAQKVPSERWKTIAFINALDLQERLEPGQLVKITN